MKLRSVQPSETAASWRQLQDLPVTPDCSGSLVTVQLNTSSCSGVVPTYPWQLQNALCGLYWFFFLIFPDWWLGDLEAVQEKGASLPAWPSLQLWGTKSNVKMLAGSLLFLSCSPGMGVGATVGKAEVILRRIRF